VRVIVVGAGVVGLASAHHLLEAGHEVLVLDAREAGYQGTSYGNAGMVVPSHFVPLAAPGAVAQALRWMPDPESPFHVAPRASIDLVRWGIAFWRASSAKRAEAAAPVLLALSRASRSAYVELEREIGPFGLRTEGLVMLSATHHGHEEEAALAERARRLGLDVATLDAAGVAALEPDAGYAVVGGVHYREDAHLDPGALMARLAAAVERRGGEVRRGVPVDRLSTRAGRVIGVSGEGVKETADAVVLAAGAWSSRLARTVGLRLPLEPGTGYSLTVPSPPHGPRLPAILTEARVAVTPLGDRLRVGGTMEMAGFPPEGSPPSATRVRGIVKALGRYLPALDLAPFRAANAWRGHRPVSPDGLPYLGAPRRLPGLVVATGHAMLGVSLAPVTGRVVAELVSGGVPGLPLGALAPDRYS
jgi:D-amino-acid dehydrogenase